MFQKLLANKHLMLRDLQLSLVQLSGGQVLSMKKKTRVEHEPRSAHGGAIN